MSFPEKYLKKNKIESNAQNISIINDLQNRHDKHVNVTAQKLGYVYLLIITILSYLVVFNPFAHWIYTASVFFLGFTNILFILMSLTTLFFVCFNKNINLFEKGINFKIKHDLRYTFWLALSCYFVYFGCPWFGVGFLIFNVLSVIINTMILNKVNNLLERN